MIMITIVQKYIDGTELTFKSPIYVTFRDGYGKRHKGRVIRKLRKSGNLLIKGKIGGLFNRTIDSIRIISKLYFNKNTHGCQ
jgi:hypothetical protein